MAKVIKWLNCEFDTIIEWWILSDQWMINDQWMVNVLPWLNSEFDTMNKVMNACKISKITHTYTK